MTFKVETFSGDNYAQDAAGYIVGRLPASGSVVLTGGTTAERIYPALVRPARLLSHLDIYFSDERCVPPDDPASNFGMAKRRLLDPIGATNVHRMRGEDPPLDAADAYGGEVRPAATAGFDLLLLGMGEDNHVAALFPDSAGLQEDERLCLPVDRPDGLKGLTLTPPALIRAKAVLLIVNGEDKAEAVVRALTSDADPRECPVRLFADHPDATFLLDEGASARTPK